MDIEYKKENENDDATFRSTIAERFRSNSFQIEFESPPFMARKDSHMSDLENFALNREASVEVLLKKSTEILR